MSGLVRSVAGAAPVAARTPVELMIAARLGDAVRWATGRLLRGHVQVLTVFAPGPLEVAAPGGDLILAAYQRDEAAMRALGVQCVRLAATARWSVTSAPDALVARLVPYLNGGGAVWLPAALDGDDVAVLTRTVGLRAATAAGIAQIWFYATSSADGIEADDDAAVSVLTARLERQVGPIRLRPHLTYLDEAARTVRRSVLACYRPSAADQATVADRADVELAWLVARGPADHAGQGGDDAGR